MRVCGTRLHTDARLLPFAKEWREPAIISTARQTGDMARPARENHRTRPRQHQHHTLPRASHMWRLRCLLLVILVLLLAPYIPAQAQHAPDPWQAFSQPQFDRIGSEDGLPANGIFSLAQDAKGYLWIGTAQGLTRYDGQHFYNILPEVDKAGGLPDGYVRSLLVLDDSHLLVGTNSAGLTLLDLHSMRFTRIPVGPERSTSAQIFSLRRANDGGVWVASDAGLDHFDPQTGIATPVSLAGLPATAPHTIFDTAEQSDQRLWIGTAVGLFVRASGQSRFHQVTDRGHLGNDLIWRLYLDHADRLWVGTDIRGLLVINPDGKTWAPPGLNGPGGLVQGHTIRDFAESEHGQMWIATYGRGMIVCQNSTCSHPRVIRGSRGNQHTPASNSIRALLLDRSGTLWLATTNGLSHTIPSHDAIVVVNGSSQNIPDMLNRSVNAILVDDRQRIWLGLGDHGVEVLDLRHGKARHIKLPAGLANQDVTSLVQTSDGTVWVGSLGVVGYDPDTLLPRTRISALDRLRITAMDAEHDDLLIGTFRGVYRLDTQTHVITPEATGKPGQQETAILAPNWMLGTGQQRWYATIHGLGVQTIGQPGVRLLQHHPGDPFSLAQDYISMLAWDPRHQRLWAATKGGLIWLHPDPDDSQQQPPFHLVSVLGKSQRIAAVVVDKAGHAWASGDNRLIKVDASGQAVVTLSRHDGLPPGNFYWRSAAVGPDGSILMGGSFGLVVIHPQRLQATTELRAPLRISHLKVNGVTLPLAQATGDTIALAADQRNIVVAFSLLDFRSPQETGYRYRLDGFENGWHSVPPGTPASAVYTNLPAGTYQLQLRAKVGGMDAHVVKAQYTLSVAPRWYETWLARLLAVLVLLLIAGALVYAGVRWSRHRRDMLDRLVRLRTLELRKANAKLERLATTDELTGLASRRSLLQKAAQAIDEAREHDQPLSILLLDLDHFKAVNDMHGHLAGDAVLRHIGATISAACRGTEFVGRLGGEEIIVCMPNSTFEDARHLAERVRSAVADQSVRYGQQTLSITCSIGVTTLEPADSMLSSLLRRADNALYVAKNKGRNRVEPDAPSAQDTRNSS